MGSVRPLGDNAPPSQPIPLSKRWPMLKGEIGAASPANVEYGNVDDDNVEDDDDKVEDDDDDGPTSPLAKSSSSYSRRLSFDFVFLFLLLLVLLLLSLFGLFCGLWLWSSSFGV